MFKNFDRVVQLSRMAKEEEKRFFGIKKETFKRIFAGAGLVAIGLIGLALL